MASVLSHDPLILCLLVCLALLLGGDSAVRVFICGLWRSVPISLYRQGACHMAGLLAAILALSFSPHAGAAACLGALAVLLLGGSVAFQPFWGIAACVLYGLYPTGIGGFSLLAALLWGGGRPAFTGIGRVVCLILLVGLGHNVASMHPIAWMIVGLAVPALSLLFGHWPHKLSMLRYCRFVRPLLCLVVMYVSHQQGLEGGAEAALFALLLDVVTQTIRIFWPQAGIMALPIPPLPGFIVGWVGLHASLGLTSGSEGWAIMGCVLGGLIAGLTMGDGVAQLCEMSVLGGGDGRVNWRLLCALAVILPPISGITATYCLAPLSVTWKAWLYSIPGGDGASLDVPILWAGGALLVVIMALRHRFTMRTIEGNEALEHSETIGGGFDGPWCEKLHAYGQAAPLRLRAIKRLIMQSRQSVRAARSSIVELMTLLPVREPDIILWLTFLGGVLVWLGLTET